MERPTESDEDLTMPGVVDPYRYPYETVAASQTAQVLGGNGAKGG